MYLKEIAEYEKQRTALKQAKKAFAAKIWIKYDKYVIWQWFGFRSYVLRVICKRVKTAWKRGRFLYSAYGPCCVVLLKMET